MYKRMKIVVYSTVHIFMINLRCKQTYNWSLENVSKCKNMYSFKTLINLLRPFTPFCYILVTAIISSENNKNKRNVYNLKVTNKSVLTAINKTNALAGTLGVAAAICKTLSHSRCHSSSVRIRPDSTFDLLSVHRHLRHNVWRLLPLKWLFVIVPSHTLMIFDC